MTKFVYSFKEGNADMRNLLGGKGANLAEMTNLGLPIPQGFTVTTEACTDYYKSGEKISDEIKDEFYKENLLKREQKKTKSDIIVFYLAMIYDMNFKYSYKFLKQNKLIEKLFEFIDSKEKFRPYFNYIGKYMKEGKEYVRKKI